MKNTNQSVRDKKNKSLLSCTIECIKNDLKSTDSNLFENNTPIQYQPNIKYIKKEKKLKDPQIKSQKENRSKPRCNNKKNLNINIQDKTYQQQILKKFGYPYDSISHVSYTNQDSIIRNTKTPTSNAQPQNSNLKILTNNNYSISNELMTNINNTKETNFNINSVNNSLSNNSNKEIMEIIEETNRGGKKNIGNNANLQKEINDLKARSKLMKDKLSIFIKLMQKYTYKLTSLTNISNNNNNYFNKRNINKKEISVSSSNQELITTLTQLNKMLNNPKLNEDIFNVTEITPPKTSKQQLRNGEITAKNEDDKLFQQQSFTITTNNNINNTNNNINNTNDNINNININTNNTNTNTNNINSNPIIITRNTNNNLNNQNISSNNTELINNGTITNNSNIIATEINESTDNKNTFSNDKNTTSNNDYVKDIEGLINKYEQKISLLNNENLNLKKNNEDQKIIQNNLLNKNIALEKEIELLRNELNEEKLNYENIIQKYDQSSKLSMNLQKKIEMLLGQNSDLKKNCVELNENLTKINMDKSNINDLESEINYKNNVINYLEGLLIQCGINPKLLSEEAYKNLLQNQNNEESFNLNKIITEKKERKNYKRKKNKSEEKIKSEGDGETETAPKNCFSFYNYCQGQNSSENMYQERKTFTGQEYSSPKLNKPQQIKKEIDVLDEEIVELQSQLKELLQQ